MLVKKYKKKNREKTELDKQHKLWGFHENEDFDKGDKALNTCFLKNFIPPVIHSALNWGFLYAVFLLPRLSPDTIWQGLISSAQLGFFILL